MTTYTCPTCTMQFTMVPYDIGSGPEVSCPNCETCFGSEGQDLDARDPLRAIGQDPELRKRLGWDKEDGTPALLLAFTDCGECGHTVASPWNWETGTKPVEHCADHSAIGSAS